MGGGGLGVGQVGKSVVDLVDLMSGCGRGDSLKSNSVSSVRTNFTNIVNK